VIDHVGTGNTRVFREIKELGQELNHLEDQIIHAGSVAKIALYFDWDNWWALDNSAGPSCLMKYKDEVLNYYRALHGLHMEVDIVGSEDELDSYQLLVAPLLYMTKPGYDEKIRSFTKAGGTFVTTFFSGIADENDLIITGGYPGRLRDILGIWVEESDALPQGKENVFIYQGQSYPATVLCDLSHLEGAESLSEYEEDFYAGMPAITCNHFGKGHAYCVLTRSDDGFYRRFLSNVCEEAKISPVMESSDTLLEITRRIKGEKVFYFLLNHGETESSICMPCSMKSLLDKKQYIKDTMIPIPAKGVLILQEGK
jgi:beta-galactosidase